MMESSKLTDLITSTLETQYFGVYNTVRNNQPHSALVGFAATPDLSKIIILTTRDTRKYINSQINHKVTLFISTATNKPSDLENAHTLSINGVAEVSDKLSADEIAEYKNYYLKKNTYMVEKDDLLKDMILITVEHYELVKNFHKTIVQTEPDLTTVHLRQLSGNILVKGSVRGKAYKIKSVSELTENFDKAIVVIDSIDRDLPTSFKAKGLIIGQSEIQESVQAALKKLDIPIIIGLGSNISNINTGQEISINGFIGVIVFTKIKN